LIMGWPALPETSSMNRVVEGKRSRSMTISILEEYQNQ
jgi:hypothetical protein